VALGTSPAGPGRLRAARAAEAGRLCPATRASHEYCWQHSLDYWRDVQPIFERRCAICHGCYDAPCQVNLTAYEGIVRDANRTPIYDISRLRTAEQTRLFEDAHSVAAWRKKQFFPVLQEQAHFWPHSDKIHEIYRRIDPLGSGLLDFNRLESR